MSKTGKILIALLLTFSLGACQIFHRPDIKQGNELPASSVEKIHKGMSKQQVEQVLGNPVLQNIYQDNRLVYIYTLKPGWGKKQKKHLIIYFSGNQVSSYTMDINLPPNLPTPNGLDLPQPTGK